VTGAAGRGAAVVTIAGTAIALRTSDEPFLRLLEQRYAGFIDLSGSRRCDYEFELELEAPAGTSPDDELQVFRRDGCWHLERGDFRAHWDPVTRRGKVRQSRNPYAIDAVLRIVHTLLLTTQGGALMHAASAIRAGKAYVFAGVSGAGKTTLARLAPGDVQLLSDEVSCVRKTGSGYRAYGTPFSGELGQPGENVDAPLSAIYLLAQGAENRIDAVSRSVAARAVLANTLFFANDAPLVRAVFHSGSELAQQVPVLRLTFVPDARVWELIGTAHEMAMETRA
jgi:hypothetical protein